MSSTTGQHWCLDTGFHSPILHSSSPPYLQRAISFTREDSSICSDESSDTMSTGSSGSSGSSGTTIVDCIVRLTYDSSDDSSDETGYETCDQSSDDSCYGNSDGTAYCSARKHSGDIAPRYMPSDLFTRVRNVYGRNPIGSSVENIATVLDDCGWSDYDVIRVLDYLMDENDHCGFDDQASRAEIYVKKLKDVLEGILPKKEL